MNTFRVEITSIEDNIIFDKVSSVSLNGLEGKLMILANHAPYVICILPGIVVIKTDNAEEKKITVDNGILEVAKNNCNIITYHFSLI
ncbi:hypothetical protein BIY23_04295 [Wolbachia pipientis]|uniref:ATP synthase F1 complex delta/epsilon subunit N-terminal domain-containing protein n=1 Tax=Wolbachia pipientis TaxID=955 RepID=A0A1E7QJ95_WOLPI|nr:hypothetical protein [Wolbachia pipientis]OEY86416.1 hypothetical protein BIY23_04295 [Wolbachia pipientis]